MDRSRIAIIIPALNEAGTIAGVLERVREYGRAIVVDDGSRDATAELARAAGADVVSLPVNRGYDVALDAGFARAAELDCAYAITIDADGQHNPAQLREMIDYLDQGYELVIGARDRHQRLGESIFALAGKLAWQVADPLCGMKGYSMALYRKAGCFDSFGSIGTELALRSVAAGARTVQMPIITRDRLDAPRFARTFAANRKILRALAIALWRYGPLSGKHV